MATYDLIRKALIDRNQVICFYQGFYRECCPHCIGTKRGRSHVLMFQFAGQSSRGLPLGGNWRCMDIDDLSQVTVQSGPWYTDPRHSRPQTCIDIVDVEVGP
jgi:hypothetical protein